MGREAPQDVAGRPDAGVAPARHRPVRRRLGPVRASVVLLATVVLAVSGVAALRPAEQVTARNAVGVAAADGHAAAGRDGDVASPAPSLTASASPSPTASRAPRPVVPARGTGRLVPVGQDLRPSVSAGRTVRYRVEIEQGVRVPADEFAGTVHEILGARRGWQSELGVRLQQVSGRRDADFTVTLASPRTTDRLCRPLRTKGELSCWNGSRAVLNAKRWVRGAASYKDDLVNYRRYLVSHEVGHALGQRHVPCPGGGRLAPVMVQQSISLFGCRANPWPNP